MAVTFSKIMIHRFSAPPHSFSAHLDSDDKLSSGVLGLKVVKEGCSCTPDVQCTCRRGSKPDPNIWSSDFDHWCCVLYCVFHERGHASCASLYLKGKMKRACHHKERLESQRSLDWISVLSHVRHFFSQISRLAEIHASQQNTFL